MTKLNFLFSTPSPHSLRFIAGTWREILPGANSAERGAFLFYSSIGIFPLNGRGSTVRAPDLARLMEATFCPENYVSRAFRSGAFFFALLPNLLAGGGPL